MDNTRPEQELETLPIGVFDLPGEPAVVINGVPSVPHSDDALILSNVADAELQGSSSLDGGFLGSSGFGEWLEGREVRKLFGERYYTGTVTQFDQEAGWYRVVYDDGDFEDLDWNELKDVLVPLDITVPLKSLALKVIKKSQKPINKSEKSGTRAQITKIKSAGNTGKEV